MPPDEIGFHHREEFVVIEQFIELDQLRLELKLELGDHLEEVHGLVSIDYHDSCSGPVGHLGIGILQDRPISHRKLVLPCTYPLPRRVGNRNYPSTCFLPSASPKGLLLENFVLNRAANFGELRHYEVQSVPSPRF